MALSNADIAELLARRGEETEGPRARAYRRAAAAAHVWPEEAADVLAAGRPLNELPGVGDRLAARIAGWIQDPPEVPEPPPARRGFMTASVVGEILRAAPGWQKGLQGDLQMHTTYSDGVATLEEMAEAAASLGYSYIAITDHSSGQRIPSGMDADAMENQRIEIEGLNRRLERSGAGLQVLRSIEMNLRPDGSGTLEAAQLEGFDLVVGSFHSDLQTADDQTQRYAAALRNPDVDIIGHPRGRMYGRRRGLVADWEAVFEVALQEGKALELNANPARQDLETELVELARDTGVKLSIGTDAHSLAELDFAGFSVARTIKAGVERHQILNFGSIDALRAWRRERSG